MAVRPHQGHRKRAALRTAVAVDEQHHIPYNPFTSLLHITADSAYRGRDGSVKRAALRAAGAVGEHLTYNIHFQFTAYYHGRQRAPAAGRRRQTRGAARCGSCRRAAGRARARAAAPRSCAGAQARPHPRCRVRWAPDQALLLPPPRPPCKSAQLHVITTDVCIKHTRYIDRKAVGCPWWQHPLLLHYRATNKTLCH